MSPRASQSVPKDGRDRRRARKSPKTNGAELVLDESTPLYVQLIIHFRQKIESGAWAVGETIPTLKDLAVDLCVARATVRQAMSFLEREGLITSRRGRGTTVISKPTRDLFIDMPRTWAHLVESADTAVGEALELDAPYRLPRLPEVTDGHLAPNYFAMRRLLERDNVPFLIGISYIDSQIIDEVGEDALTKMSVYRVLEKSKKIKIVSVNQLLTLRTVDAESAYLLDIPLGAPIASVQRWAWDRSDTLVYQSEGFFRTDFVRVTRRLK